MPARQGSKPDGGATMRLRLREPGAEGGRKISEFGDGDGEGSQ
jgi:hypothetical protein